MTPCHSISPLLYKSFRPPFSKGGKKQQILSKALRYNFFSFIL